MASRPLIVIRCAPVGTLGRCRPSCRERRASRLVELWNYDNSLLDGSGRMSTKAMVRSKAVLRTILIAFSICGLAVAAHAQQRTIKNISACTWKVYYQLDRGSLQFNSIPGPMTACTNSSLGGGQQGYCMMYGGSRLAVTYDSAVGSVWAIDQSGRSSDRWAIWWWPPSEYIRHSGSTGIIVLNDPNGGDFTIAGCGLNRAAHRMLRGRRAHAE